MYIMCSLLVSKTVSKFLCITNYTVIQHTNNVVSSYFELIQALGWKTSILMDFKDPNLCKSA